MVGWLVHSLLLVAIVCYAQDLHRLHPSLQAPMTETTTSPGQCEVGFDAEWELLGPFQIGTREAAWGSDPLELHGGFHSLQYDPTAVFRSSLAANGTVSWSRRSQSPSQSAGPSSTTVFDFPDVTLPALEAVYGWPSLQWQAWARSYFFVSGDHPRTFVLHLTGVLEYWLDGHHVWGGDYYGLMLSPKVLHLHPGKHQIDLRLVRDVRVMGASSSPGVGVEIRLAPVRSGTRLVSSDTLLPDVVGDGFVSALGSVALTNVHGKPIKINRVFSDEDIVETTLLGSTHVTIYPGQSRPVAFRISSHGEVPSLFKAYVEYSVEGELRGALSITQKIRRRNKLEAQKVTYLHPGNVVSYAVLRPPSVKDERSASSDRRAPVLLFLHGSGITADSDAVVNSLNSTQNLEAWTIFASGVTAWCGDDWHNWGWRDVEAAVKAVPEWIKHNQWQGPGIDDGRWLVTGHSNGGQGVWYALAHHPDRLIAAAPAAGYTSLQAYVPYSLWAEVEPARSALIHSTLNSYRLELLVPWNAAGIPIGIQHGSADDNVPVHHSRRMFQLLDKSSSSVSYNEVPGVGHVFDDMMGTEFLTQFFAKWLSTPDRARTIPQFTIVTANPSDTGSKCGIRIEQLIVPGRLGKIQVEVEGNKLNLKTSNVRQIGVSLEEWQKVLSVDNDDLGHISQGPVGTVTTFELVSKKWQVAARPNVPSHLGGLDAILRTQDTFSVIMDSEGVQDIALQVSSNLLAYFGADSVISSSSDGDRSRGNRIVVGSGRSGIKNIGTRDPIKIADTGIHITTLEKDTYEYKPGKNGLGAIFLRPSRADALEMVVWGADKASLDVAARLVPMMTGTGQPDFIIMDQSTKWRGIDGVLAMGFIDGGWQIGRSASFFS